MTAKTVLVTGATDGLGRALARKLAASGAAVLIHGRDRERIRHATYMPTKIVASPTSTLEEGVAATLALVADPELEGVTGTYFNGIHESRADPQAYDPDARRRLAVFSRALVGSHQADA